MTQTIPFHIALMNAFEKVCGVAIFSITPPSELAPDPLTSDFDDLDNAMTKFMAKFRRPFAGLKWNMLLGLAEKLLVSRTTDEIHNAEAFVKSILSEHTDVVEVLKLALDSSLPVGYVGFKDGNKYEYFAVLAALLAKKGQQLVEGSVEGEPINSDIKDLLSWVESQTTKAFDAAEGDFRSAHLPPDKENEVMFLMDFMSDRTFIDAFVGMKHIMVPGMIIPVVKKLLESPGAWEVLSIAVAAADKRVKSEGARKAGKELGGPLTKLKQQMILKYHAGTWNSPNHAARELCKAMNAEIGILLSKDRRVATVANWFRAEDKANKQRQLKNNVSPVD